MNKRCWLIIFIALTLLTACHRQALEDAYYEKAYIPVAIDWSKCGLNPQNVSMFFYHQSDGSLAMEHYFENNTNEVQSYIRVPVGEYIVVVFNELPGQIKNVNIGGKDRFSTLEAYGTETTDVTLPVKGETYIKQPDEIAVVVVKNFKVTYDMVYYTNIPGYELEGTDPSKKLMGLVPISKISTFEIIVHIKGLENARMPALVNLTNMSGTYLFEEDINSMLPVAYQFTVNNRTYDPGSVTEGTISGKASVFGVLGQRGSSGDQPSNKPITLELVFMLVNEEKTIVNDSYDITDDIVFSRKDDGDISIKLDLEVNTPLPDVTPEGGDSGFGTSIVNWDVVDIPLDAN